MRLKNSAPVLGSMKLINTYIQVIGLFGFSENRKNYGLNFFYSNLTILAYTMVLLIPIDSTKKLESTNAVVINIQFVCIAALMYANHATWFKYSHEYYKQLEKIVYFDSELRNLPINHRKIQTVIHCIIAAQTLLVIYFFISDFILNVYLLDMSPIYWIKVEIPILINYINSTFISITFYILYKRFITLTSYVDVMLNPQVSNFKDQLKLKFKHLVKLYSLLSNVTHFMTKCFSLSILTTLLMSFVTITNQLYLLLKVKDLKFTYKCNLLNNLTCYLLVLIIVTFSYHLVKKQVSL